MKDRGKDLQPFPNAAEPSNFLQNNNDDDNNNNINSTLFCKKHPSTSSAAVGICALCLNDRLVELVCPECGEQRLSSCSCSELSSNPNSNPEGVASVGRISFLLENDKKTGQNSNLLNMKHHPGQYYSGQQYGPSTTTKLSDPDPPFLRRSNSTCVAIDGINTRRGFWRIGKLFKKKTQKDTMKTAAEYHEDDSKSEMCVSDIVGVSRSRSVCSFRGNYMNYDHESNRNSCGGGGGGGGGVLSGARASSVSTGFMMDSAKRSCFSESEARMSNFECDKDLLLGCPPLPPPLKGPPASASSFFAMREVSNGGGVGEFSCGDDDPRFIDLKLDLSSSSSTFEAARGGSNNYKEYGAIGFGSVRGGGEVSGSSSEYVGGHYGNFRNAASSSSSRFSNVSEGEIRKCSRKRHKVWRWFFKGSAKLGK